MSGISAGSVHTKFGVDWCGGVRGVRHEMCNGWTNELILVGVMVKFPISNWAHITDSGFCARAISSASTGAGTPSERTG